MRKNLEQLIDELNLQVMALCKSFCGHDELKNQLYRSSMSIGANKAEAKYAESSADFVHKMSIALKECSETKYWLKQLYNIIVGKDKEITKAINKCGSIERKLIESIRTAQKP